MAILSKELGNTGVQIPEIGLGTWQYHAGPEPLRKGLEAGALFIDTAESYGSEPVVAEVLPGQRERVFVATKVSRSHLRYSDVISAANNSLARLCTDYIDLYQIHEPDDSIPMEETVGAMEDLVDAGKIRFVGVSNFSVAQLQRAQRAMKRHPIVSNQVRFSLVDRTISAEVLPYCQANRVTVIAYSPLARGLQHILDCDPRGALTKLAKVIGRTPVQVALNWCLCQEGVVAIPKGNSREHVLENCGASGWRLAAEQIRELDQAIAFRRRSRFESFVRRQLPPGLIANLKRLTQRAPPALRRRIY